MMPKPHAPFAIRLFETQIGRNPVNPGGESCFWLIGVPCAVNPEKYFLRQFLRFSRVIDNFVNKIDNRFLILVKNMIKCFTVALLKSNHQCRIRVD